MNSTRSPFPRSPTQRSRLHRVALASIVIATLAACASAPKHNAALDDAQAGYDRAAADTRVARSAPLELRRAQQALQAGAAAQRSGEDAVTVEHYAYLAKQQTEIAMQAATVAQAEQAVADASQQRDSILIDSRTREAQAQRMLAEGARVDADSQRTLADRARVDAQAQRALGDQARLDADTQRTAADAARKMADEQQSAAQSSQAQAVTERARATSLEEQLALLKAKPTEQGIVLTLGDVLFDTGRADLSSGATRPLDLLAAFLKENAQRTVTIAGYTDSAGTAPSNQVLSERRAEAVKNGLVDRGIAANRISARGMGESRPVASNATAAGRQQNRRVEIVLSDAR